MVSESDLVKWFEENYPIFGFTRIRRREKYPDFDAYLNDKRLRVEIESKASNFLTHGHDIWICDMVICYEKDVELPILVFEVDPNSGSVKIHRPNPKVVNQFLHKELHHILYPWKVAIAETLEYYRQMWGEERIPFYRDHLPAILEDMGVLTPQESAKVFRIDEDPSERPVFVVTEKLIRNVLRNRRRCRRD